MKRITRKTAFGGLAALVGVGIMLVAWRITLPEEPSFQGRSLTDWLVQVRDREDLAAALHAMEPNAVPLLTQQLDRAPSRASRLREHLDVGGVLSSRFPPRPDPRLFAAYGLGILGPVALEAAPALEALQASASDDHLRLTTTFALMRIRGESPGYYIEKLADTSDAAANDWHESVSMIMMFGREASNAVPLLIEALGTTNNLNYRLVQARACEALGAVRSRPDIAVPALANALASPNLEVKHSALRALNEFGAEARAARTAVAASLHDPDPWIRTNSALLLREMDSQSGANERLE